MKKALCLKQTFLHFFKKQLLSQAACHCLYILFEHRLKFSSKGQRTICCKLGKENKDVYYI